MKAVPALIAILMIGCPFGYAANGSSARSTKPMPTPERSSHCDARDSSDIAECGESYDRFIVIYTMEYGYSFRKEEELDTVIVPEFENKETLDEINRFFFHSDLTQYYGKKIYCDCVGETIHRGGATFYKVRGGHIYAK